MSEAQSALPRLLKSAEQGDAVCIRRHNQPVAYILSQERMEAIVETMEILANPAAMRAIREHRAKKTKFVPLSKLDAAVAVGLSSLEAERETQSIVELTDLCC